MSARLMPCMVMIVEASIALAIGCAILPSYLGCLAALSRVWCDACTHTWPRHGTCTDTC
jgi:hypothetical protein